MCIEKSQVCDGVPQCQDRSDELQCVTLIRGCVHHCDNKTRCVPANFLCDGEEDCSDGTDEAICGTVWCIYITELTLVFMLDLCIYVFFWFWIIMLSPLYFILFLLCIQQKTKRKKRPLQPLCLQSWLALLNSPPLLNPLSVFLASYHAVTTRSVSGTTISVMVKQTAEMVQMRQNAHRLVKRVTRLSSRLLLIWLYCHLVSNTSFTSVLVHGQLALWLFTIRAPLKITIAIVFS